jgi:hypothetical protein
MRQFLPERPDKEQNLVLVKQLRTNKPLAPYARRSDPTAKDARRDHTQSREMQTEDMIVWGLHNGWPLALIFPYFADLGLSGTLRPDQRPDMLRLFDDLDSGKLDGGTIACWQENRPFRDETHIYYNQLIDKMLQHNVVLVVISPRLYIYDMRDPFDKERLREKFKEAAEFIPKHVKGWLHPARERAAWVYGEWAGLGGLPPGFIVDYDKDSPTYKKVIPYWPHIEKTKEKFQLFMELGGDIGLFYNRLRKSPIIYPEFESWVDKRTINRFNLSQYPGGGYYIRGRHSLVSLLTHPLHYGYRSVNGVIRRNDLGEKIREFEPVIDLELLDFAYYRLAKTDFDGNPIAASSKPRRYFQQDSDGLYGLLKFRIRSNQGEVRTRSHGDRPGLYLIETVSQDDYIHDPDVSLAMPCEEIDTIIVKRLMEHVHDISKKRESVETYQQQVNTIRKKRQSKIKQLEASINDINRKQAGLTLSLGNVELEIEEAKQVSDTEKQERLQHRKELITEQIDILETERRTLIQAKADLEREAANDYGSLDEELEELETLWPEYTFEHRRSLINFIVKEVVIDSMSTHWLRIQVLWLHEEWGREEMFYLRRSGKRKEWTDEETELMRANYASMSYVQLMALLPDKSWKSIYDKGKYSLGITRTTGRPKPGEETVPHWAINYSYADLEFMREQGIADNARCTNWVQVFL